MLTARLSDASSMRAMEKVGKQQTWVVNTRTRQKQKKLVTQENHTHVRTGNGLSHNGYGDRNTLFTTEARVAWQIRKFFFAMVGYVSLCSCVVEIVLWESCLVTRSPPCGRLHRDFQAFVTIRPCICMDGQRRRHSFKRRQHHEDVVVARTKKNQRHERRGHCYSG